MATRKNSPKSRKERLTKALDRLRRELASEENHDQITTRHDAITRKKLEIANTEAHLNSI